MLLLLVPVIAWVCREGLEAPFKTWDDPVLIAHNPLIRALDAEHVSALFTRGYEGFYIPVTLLSYAVDFKFSTLESLGYRARIVPGIGRLKAVRQHRSFHLALAEYAYGDSQRAEEALETAMRLEPDNGLYKRYAEERA